MASKLAHGVVTYSLPKGEKNVTTSQNIEVVDAKGIPHLYRPQRSCGKVMFSQASVIMFTGGGCMPSMHWGRHPPGRHPLGRHSPGQTPPWADTSPGQTSPPGKHPPPDGYCSGRYASYWNAFLYFIEKGSFGGQCTKFVYSAV